MVRNDYIDGQSFPFPKWNSLALLNDNITTFNNNVYTTYYPGLSLVGAPVAIDGALGSTDVLNGEVANLQTNSDFNEEFTDALKTNWTTEVNADQPTPSQIVNTEDVLNATNITELETLSWYDSDQQDGVNSLFINEQMEIYESGYTRDALVQESPVTLSEVSKNYVEGDIWLNDLTKTHSYASNRYRQWTNPSGALVADITHGTLAAFDETFDTAENWDYTSDENVTTNVNFDGTHLYVYRFRTIVFYKEFSDDWDMRVYCSYVVSKIDTGGNIVSENQYNFQPDSGTYTANDSSGNNSVDTDGKGVMTVQTGTDSILYASMHLVDVDEDDDHRDYDMVTAYGKATPTGWVSAGGNTNANSWDRNNGDEDVDYGSYITQKAANDTTQMILIGHAEEETQSDDDDAGRVNAFAVVVDGGVLSLKSYSIDSGFNDNAGSNLTVPGFVDNTTCKIWFSAGHEDRRSQSGPDPEDSYTAFLEASAAGISTIASVSNNGSTAFRYSSTYSIKMCPNYITDTMDVYYKYDKKYTDGVTPTESFYFQLGVGAISEDVYNSVISFSAYSLSGAISNGLAAHGITYTMGVDDDTAGYFHTGRPGQHQAVTYDIVTKELNATEALPTGVRTYFQNV